MRSIATSIVSGRGWSPTDIDNDHPQISRAYIVVALNLVDLLLSYTMSSGGENYENGYDDMLDRGQPSNSDLEDDTGRLMIITPQHSRKIRIRNFAYLLIAVAISAVLVILVALLGVLLGVRRSREGNTLLPSDPNERAVALLTDYPVIDGYVSTI